MYVSYLYCTRYLTYIHRLNFELKQNHLILMVLSSLVVVSRGDTAQQPSRVVWQVTQALRFSYLVTATRYSYTLYSCPGPRTLYCTPTVLCASVMRGPVPVR